MIVIVDVRAAAALRLLPERAVVVMFGLVLIAVGNLLPRTRPNVAVGLRTARTLTDPQLWQRMHRIGGYATVALGLVIAVSGVMLAHEAVGAVVGSAALAVAMALFLTYRRSVATPAQPNARI